MGSRRHSVHMLYICGIVLAYVLLADRGIVQAKPFAYVANSGANTVSVIDTATHAVTATVTVGQRPSDIAVHPAGTSVYVLNGPLGESGTVSVMNAATNTVTATLPVGVSPSDIVMAPSTQTLTGAPLVAAVLPSSRSVQVGTPATAFATIINTGQATADSCSLAPPANFPATFTFQTTHPTTNELAGTPGTPVDIPAGAAQSFVFAFTPTGPVAPTEVMLNFDCANTPPAASTAGLNTLLLTAASTPVPDIVALAATPMNDGVVRMPGATETGVFAVATVNVGASGTLTAVADTGGMNLPVALTLCETNPTSGACVASPASSVTTQSNTNTTPTFGIFVASNGTVLFDPARHRIFVRFMDAGGVTRGATSVAVQTQ